MEEITKKQLIGALKKHSWRTKLGRGVVVCYPDAILMELFGQDVFNEIFFECPSNEDGKHPKETPLTNLEE